MFVENHENKHDEKKNISMPTSDATFNLQSKAFVCIGSQSDRKL
jgi:hypothetical protein